MYVCMYVRMYVCIYACLTHIFCEFSLVLKKCWFTGSGTSRGPILEWRCDARRQAHLICSYTAELHSMSWGFAQTHFISIQNLSNTHCSCTSDPHSVLWFFHKRASFRFKIQAHMICWYTCGLLSFMILFASKLDLSIWSHAPFLLIHLQTTLICWYNHILASFWFDFRNMCQMIYKIHACTKLPSDWHLCVCRYPGDQPFQSTFLRYHVCAIIKGHETTFRNS